MRLQLSVLRLHSGSTDQGSTHVFDEAGGTIGRSADCDWSLPDQSRTLSSLHAQVSHNGRGFSITDTSTNGVYLNSVDSPLGRYQSAPLNDGDTLYLAGYVISVSVIQDEKGQPHSARAAEPENSVVFGPRIPDEFDFGDLDAPGRGSSGHVPNAGKMEREPAAPPMPPIPPGRARPTHAAPAPSAATRITSFMEYSARSRPEAATLPQVAPPPIRQAAAAPSRAPTFGEADVFWSTLGLDPAAVPATARQQVMAGLGHALREVAQGLLSSLPDSGRAEQDDGFPEGDPPGGSPGPSASRAAPGDHRGSAAA